MCMTFNIIKFHRGNVTDIQEMSHISKGIVVMLERLKMPHHLDQVASSVIIVKVFFLFRISFEKGLGENRLKINWCRFFLEYNIMFHFLITNTWFAWFVLKLGGVLSRSKKCQNGHRCPLFSQLQPQTWKPWSVPPQTSKYRYRTVIW